jgi:hypothetical protein
MRLASQKSPTGASSLVTFHGNKFEALTSAIVSSVQNTFILLVLVYQTGMVWENDAVYTCFGRTLGRIKTKAAMGWLRFTGEVLTSCTTDIIVTKRIIVLQVNLQFGFTAEHYSDFEVRKYCTIAQH